MFKYIFILAICLSTNSMSQVLDAEFINKDEVPENIQEGHLKLYADSLVVKWHKVGGLSYRADFKLMSDSLSVLYRADGKVLYERKLITQDQLPEGLLEFVREDNKGYPITKIYHESDRDKTVYVFYLDTGDRYKEVKLEY